MYRCARSTLQGCLRHLDRKLSKAVEIRSRNKLRQCISAESSLCCSGANMAQDNGTFHSTEWQQAGQNAEDIDIAGPGAHGMLNCSVGKPQKEGEGIVQA